MIYIQIAEELADELLRYPLDEAWLEATAGQALKLAAPDSDADVSLVLTGDAQIHDLNRQFRQVDAPTDVLSFSVGETDPDTGNLYLGDIVISYPRALAQAQADGRAAADELQLLVVHGLLHLLGHDHADESEKAAMWAAQADILARLGGRMPPAIAGG